MYHEGGTMSIIEEIQGRFWKDVSCRFWAKVNRGKDDECWIWIGAKNDKGYGTIQVYGKSYYAHRFSFELVKGPVAKDSIVMHACDSPSCVNPAHLKLGTQLQNMRDMITKGRARRPGMITPLAGESNPAAIINTEQARLIRNSYDPMKGYRSLADQFKISKSQAYRIVKGASWKIA
jgi:HNH endonuclease